MSKRVDKPVRTEAKRYALYTRVSTDQQLEGREYDSLASQEDFLVRWATRIPRDGSVAGEVYKVYTDTASGTKYEERPGLMALITDAMAGRFDEAVAYNLDRWCRSLDIHGLIKRVERETGVRFVSATQEFSKDAEGEFLENNLANVNQYYSKVISKKVKIKRQLKADRGEWNGGCRPYGYTSVDGKLVVIAEQGATVRRIFELFIQHPSAVSVRARLAALGIKDRKGQPWSSSSIEAILRNPIYKGEIRMPGGGTGRGVHEALISAETWDLAHAIVPTRKRLTTKIDRSFPLAGLLQCGACNAQMTLHYVSNKAGRKYPRYRCTTTFQRGWKACPIKEVNAEHIEHWVKDQISKLGAEGELLRAAIAAANTADENTASPLRVEEAALMSRINDVRKKVDRLVGAIADGGSGFASIRAKLTLEERSLRVLEHELSKVKTEIHRVAGDVIDEAKLRHVLADFDTLFAVASAAERKELLQLLIKRIVFRGHDADVTLELFSAVNLVASSSIVRAPWLRRRVSKLPMKDKFLTTHAMLQSFS